MNTQSIMPQLCSAALLALTNLWGAALPEEDLAPFADVCQQVSFTLEDAKKQHTIKVAVDANIWTFKQAVAIYLTDVFRRPIVGDQLIVAGRSGVPYQDSSTVSEIVSRLKPTKLFVLLRGF